MSEKKECTACKEQERGFKPLNRRWVASIWAALGITLGIFLWARVFHMMTGQWPSEVVSKEFSTATVFVFMASGMYGVIGGVIYLLLNVIGRNTYRYSSGNEWHNHDHCPESLCGVYYDQNRNPIDLVWQIPVGGWFSGFRILTSAGVTPRTWSPVAVRGKRVEIRHNLRKEHVICNPIFADQLVRDDVGVPRLQEAFAAERKLREEVDRVRTKLDDQRGQCARLSQVMLTTILEIRKTKPRKGHESKGSAVAARAAAWLEAGLARYAEPSDEEVARWKAAAEEMRETLDGVIVPRAMRDQFSSEPMDALAAATRES